MVITPEQHATLTDSQIRDLYATWFDHAEFCRQSLTIVDERSRLVPLRLSKAQSRANEYIRRQESRGKPVRGMILKARRVHVSAGISAQGFHRVPFWPHMHGVCVSHLESSVQANAQYYRHYDQAYRDGPGYMGVRLPARGAPWNQSDMTWANGSAMHFRTAGSAEFARGGSSYQFAHLTEFAFWPDAELVMRALGQVMAPSAGTMQIIESTANGMGGLFYEMWLESQRPGSDMWGMFFAWWEHEDNVLPVHDVERFGNSLTAEERAEQQRYGLSFEQLEWRRWCIRYKCQGSLDTFRQEHPGNPEEAFLFSGRPRFCTISLGRQPIQREPLRGSLRLHEQGLRKQVAFDVRADGQGEVEVWRRPEQGRRYVIGADVAQGIDVSAKRGGKSDPDYSVAHVLDADTGEQVASFAERWTPDRFAELLWLLGWWYGVAYLVPERNKDGIAVISSLMRLQYPLERIWVDTGRLPHDRRTPLLEELGFLTSSKSKHHLIAHLDEALKDGAVVVRKARTLVELRAFTTIADGSMEGAGGTHDDEVLALALAEQGRRRAPEVFARQVVDQTAGYRVAGQQQLLTPADVEDMVQDYRMVAPHRRVGWRGGN